MYLIMICIYSLVIFTANDNVIKNVVAPLKRINDSLMVMNWCKANIDAQIEFFCSFSVI